MTTSPLVDTHSDVLRAARDPAAADAKRRARARRRWIKRGVAIAAAVALAFAVALALRPAPIAVELAPVRRGTLQVTIDEDGRTRLRDRYTVVAPLGGELARIALRAGDPVARGDVIARLVPQAPALLDPRSRAEAEARLAAAQSASLQARTEVRRVEAALAHVQADADRDAKLAASGSISPEAATHSALDAKLRSEELSSALFGAETAAHDVAVANAVLARYGDGAKAARDSFAIASPIEGRVLRVFQQSAGMVAPSTPLLELGDPAQLEVVVDVLTQDAVAIPPHARVVLDRWGGERPLGAHVRVVEPSGFTRLSALGVEEQRVSVIVDLDDPPAERPTLGDGFRVEAHVVTWQGDDVLVLPSSAVFRRGGGWAVFTVTGDRAHVRSIEVGRRSTSDVQVLTGVAQGERVVLHPSDKLADDTRVAAR